jgi:hypothetical protein
VAPSSVGAWGTISARQEGSTAQAGCESTEGVEAVADKAVDPDPVTLGLVLRPLQCAEETSGARDGYRDETQLAKIASPLLGVDPLEGGKLLED